LVVQRVWSFNSLLAAPKILKALRALKPDGAVYNLQTASFGDREIPAALGLLTPAISQFMNTPSGVIMHNLIEAVDLSKTNLGGNKLRQKLVSFAGSFVTRFMLDTGYVTVTLDSFADILKSKYKSKNAFMVPHGAFENENADQLPRLADRPARVVTMGKFGTYKRLERTIAAVQSINEKRTGQKIQLVIGGSDHPATPGYLKGLSEKHKADENIVFHGYVAEEEVRPFFADAKMAIFDYDSTTGSSGVLHQAAIFGTPAAYPLIGDFVDVTEREGLSGYHFEPFDQSALEDAILSALADVENAQRIADSNLTVSQSVTMHTVAAVHMRLLDRLQKGRLLKVQSVANSATRLEVSEINIPRTA